MFPAAFYPTALFPGALYPPAGKGLPAVPTGLSATIGAPGAVSLSWIPAVAGPRPTAFQLQRSADRGATWVSIATTTSTRFADSGLNPSTSYSYRVAATDPDGVSAFSATIAVLTASPPPQPRYYPGLFRQRRPRHR